MKLFVFAALVAVASAGRLEHLERSYLPPDNNAQNGNHFGSGNHRFGASGHSSNGFAASGHGSNGFGASGYGSNGFGASGHSSNGFGASGHSSNGFGASGHGSNGFGASGHSSNEFGASGHNSNGFGSNNGANGFASNVRSSFDHSESHGSHGFGAPFVSSSNGLSRNAAFGVAMSNQYLPPNHGPSGSLNNGVSEYGSHNAFSTLGSSHGSRSKSQGSVSQPQFAAASRQYLAPKFTSSQQANPQQPFDKKSGYIY